MTVDGHEVAVFQGLGRAAYTIDTGDTEFTRNDRTVDQHSATAFDDGTRKRYQVCHRRLDRIADEDFAAPELAKVASPANAAYCAGGNTG